MVALGWGRRGQGRGWSLRSSNAIDARPSSLRPQTTSSVQLVLSALEKERALKTDD